MRVRGSVAVICAVLILAAWGAHAQGPPSDAPTPEQMMEMMEKLAAPGPGHEVLGRCTGTFTTRMKSWMEPGAPPIESEGKQTSRWILGGRYVVDDYESTFMGKAFHGMGINAYDNYKKQYISTWMDTMSTGIMILRGQYDDATRTLTLDGTFDDPTTGTPTKVKSVGRFVDADTHVFEMYMGMPGGEWFKNMEITYTRVK